MANTGIKVNDECVSTFQEFMKRNSTIRYCLLEIKDDKEVVIKKKVDKKDGETWKEFVDEFNEQEVNYAFYMMPCFPSAQQQNDNSQKDEKPILLKV